MTRRPAETPGPDRDLPGHVRTGRGSGDDPTGILTKLLLTATPFLLLLALALLEWCPGGAP